MGVNDKIIDAIIEAAVDKYADMIEDEKIVCSASDEEINKTKRQNYENVMKRIHQYEKEKKRSLGKTEFSVELAPKVPYKIWSQIKRPAFVAITAGVFCIMLVFNVSAFKIFLYKTYMDIAGNEFSISTSSIQEKYATITNFDPLDEIIIPTWMPKGTELTIVSNDEFLVALDYNISGGKYFTLSIKRITHPDTSSDILSENNIIDAQITNIMGHEGIIAKVQTEQKLLYYNVVWSSDKVRYKISTDVNNIMLESILSGLEYYN